MSKKMQSIISMYALAAMSSVNEEQNYILENGKEYSTQDNRTEEEKERDYENIMNKKGVYKFYYNNGLDFVWARTLKAAQKKIDKKKNT